MNNMDEILTALSENLYDFKIVIFDDRITIHGVLKNEGSTKFFIFSLRTMSWVRSEFDEKVTNELNRIAKEIMTLKYQQKKT